MIREKRQRPNQIIIDLTGPDGNAFALNEKKILKEMQSSDYENLLEVFDDHFGSFVILER